MDKQFVFWLVIFIVGATAWFVSNIDRGEYNYVHFPNLMNKTTGKHTSLPNTNVVRILSEAEFANQSTSETRLYNLLYVANLLSPFSNDQYYAYPEDKLIAGGPAVNQTLCGEQLGWLVGKLIENPNITSMKGELAHELTMLMDTYGRFQAGTFRGDHISLGSYNYCIRSKLKRGQIDNRYCLSRFTMKSWPPTSIAYPPPTLSFGVCIPESCDTNSYDIHKPLLEFLAKYHMSQQERENLRFDYLFCLPDEKSPLRKWEPMAYIFMVVVVGWCLMILIASAIHEYLFRRRHKQNLLNQSSYVMSQKQEGHLNGMFADSHNKHIELYKINDTNKGLDNDDNRNKTNEPQGRSPQTINDIMRFEDKRDKQSDTWAQLFEGLSVRHSIKVFKSCNFRIRNDRRESVRVDLSSLDFLKSVFIIFIVMGHSFLLSAFFAKSIRGRIEMTTGDISKVAISIGRFVDTFFVFFGVLSAFTLLRKLRLSQLSNPFSWIITNIGIYLRIMPIFMLVYVFNRSIMPHMGSGPFWDYGIDRILMRSICKRESWVKILPPFGSIGIPPVPSCNPPSWFLVSYSQIALFLPVLTYLLIRIRSTVWRVLLIAFLNILSAVNVGYRLYVQEVVEPDLFTYYGGMMVTLVDKYESSGYMDTLTRLGSVSIGCLVGYLLHLYAIGRIQEWPYWLRSKYFTFFNMCLHAVVYCLPLIAIRIYWYTGQLVTLQQFVAGNMIAYTIWPILNGLLIMNMCTVSARHVLVRFMSHPVWHVFNKLGLAILLVQYEIMIYGITEFEYGLTYGYIIDIIKLGSYGLVLSIAVAFCLYILCEAPINHLAMMMLKPIMLAYKPSVDEEPDISKDQVNEKLTITITNNHHEAKDDSKINPATETGGGA